MSKNKHRDDYEDYDFSDYDYYDEDASRKQRDKQKSIDRKNKRKGNNDGQYSE